LFKTNTELLIWCHTIK